MIELDLTPLANPILQAAGRLFGTSPADVALAFKTILIGAVTNVSCGVLGCYLVLRRMSLLGDAISHAVLPGLALAFFLSGNLTVVPMFLGAMTFGVLTAWLTQTLSNYGRVPEDSSMGVVFTSLFAVGVIMISQVGRVHIDKDCVLEGAIEFVAIDTVPFLGMEVPLVLRSLLPVLLLTVLFIAVFWKELKIASFDPMLASAMGFSAAVIHYLLMGMVALVTVAAFEAVGSILVVAMLIVPGATAHLLTDRLGWMLFWAAVVGTLAAVFGHLGAIYFSTSAAGMMAVAAGAQFLLAVLFAPHHSLSSKALNNFRLAVRIASEDIIAMLYRLQEKRTGSTGETPVARRADCLRIAGGGFAAWWALRRLAWQSFIAIRPEEAVQLTTAGRQLGESLVRSHRLWEAYLEENFALPPDHLHEPAERLEHYIGPSLQEKLARELDLPQVDPHGRTIPPTDRGTS